MGVSAPSLHKESTDSLIKGCKEALPKTQKLGIGMAACKQDSLQKDYLSDPIPAFFIR